MARGSTRCSRLSHVAPFKEARKIRCGHAPLAVTTASQRSTRGSSTRTAYPAMIRGCVHAMRLVRVPLRKSKASGWHGVTPINFQAADKFWETTQAVIIFIQNASRGVHLSDQQPRLGAEPHSPRQSRVFDGRFEDFLHVGGHGGLDESLGVQPTPARHACRVGKVACSSGRGTGSDRGCVHTVGAGKLGRVWQRRFGTVTSNVCTAAAAAAAATHMCVCVCVHMCVCVYVCV